MDRLYPFLVMLWQVINQVHEDGLSKREVMLGLISTVFKTGIDMGMTVPDIDTLIAHVHLTYSRDTSKDN